MSELDEPASSEVGYTVDLDDEDRLRRKARAIRLRKQIVGWSLALLPLVAIILRSEVYAAIAGMPKAFALGPGAVIVVVLLVITVWIATPYIIFEIRWRYRLDIGTRASDTFQRAIALLRVTEIYAENEKYSFRSLLLAGAGASLLWEHWQHASITWTLALGAGLVAMLMVLAHIYPTRRIGPYLIDNILFVCIRSEQSTMSHQEAADHLAHRESPKMRRLRPDLYY